MKTHDSAQWQKQQDKVNAAFDKAKASGKPADYKAATQASNILNSTGIVLKCDFTGAEIAKDAIRVDKQFQIVVFKGLVPAAANVDVENADASGHVVNGESIALHAAADFKATFDKLAKSALIMMGGELPRANRLKRLARAIAVIDGT